MWGNGNWEMEIGNWGLEWKMGIRMEHETISRFLPTMEMVLPSADGGRVDRCHFCESSDYWKVVGTFFVSESVGMGIEKCKYHISIRWYILTVHIDTLSQTVDAARDIVGWGIEIFIVNSFS